MTLEAPAKVNLTLRVSGMRGDGFHEIETFMVPTTLCDRIELSIGPGEGIELVCDAEGVPCDNRNLVWRAVEAFQAATGEKFRASIRLEKRIPHGAGLGGGSSDAAAVLKALDELVGTRFSIDRLERLAAGLGSDVPFFIRCAPAVCRGRGEIVEPLVCDLPDVELLVVKPPFGVPTAWAYSAFAAGGKSRGTFSGSAGSISMGNDLEAPVFAKFLILPVLKRWLLGRNGVEGAMMSGSGSAVFALVRGGAVEIAGRVASWFGPGFSTVACRLAAGPR